MADVAVTGVLSARWGETPVAFVVLRPHAIVRSAELRDWANGKLGKVLKRELRIRRNGVRDG